MTGAKLNCNTRGKYHSVPGEARDCHKGKDVALAWRACEAETSIREASGTCVRPGKASDGGEGAGLHMPEMFGQRHSTSVICTS